MIPIEQQVTNLDLSRRLAAAGVPQDASRFYWFLALNTGAMLFERIVGDSWDECFANVNDVHEIFPSIKDLKESDDTWECYAAYTPAELGEWLPPDINYSRELNLGEKLKWWSSGIRHIEAADTLADAMGEMLLYLINKGYVKPEELK